MKIYVHTKKDSSAQHFAEEDICEAAKKSPEVRKMLALIALVCVVMMISCTIDTSSKSYCSDFTKNLECYDAAMIRYEYAKAIKLLNETLIDKLGIRSILASMTNLDETEYGSSRYHKRKIKSVYDNKIALSRDWYALRARLTSVLTALKLLKGEYVIDEQIEVIKKQLKQKSFFISSLPQDTELRELVEADLICFKEIKDNLRRFTEGDYASICSPMVMSYAEPPKNNRQCARTYIAYFIKYIEIKQPNTPRKRRIELANQIITEAQEHAFLPDMIDFANKLQSIVPNDKRLPLEKKKL